MKKQKEKEKEKENTYILELTEKQARTLSYACDRLSRIICGQDWTYKEFMEEAWEKRAKEATGNYFDNEFEGGWDKARRDAEDLAKEMKRLFWGLEYNAMYGVGYDDTSDILYDLHQVIRHQLYLDKPDDQKSPVTVDAYEATRFGSEPLAVIRRKEKKEEKENNTKTFFNDEQFNIQKVSQMDQGRH